MYEYEAYNLNTKEETTLYGYSFKDACRRAKTKREALATGRACNQISILNWRTMGLAYC